MTMFFIAVMAGVAYYVFNQAVKGERLVTVPEITGMSITQAANILTQAGLELGSQRLVVSDQVPEYHIIVQRPSPNTVVRAGRKVNLTVSQGREALPAPSWVGLSLEDALKQIEAARFLGGSIARMPNDAPRGTILAQQPAPSREVSEGAEIHLLVSDGPKSDSLVMPDLVGLSLEDAQLQLGTMNVLAVPNKINREGEEYEVVLGQTPPAGTKLAPNQEVTFDVRLRPTSFLPNARRKVSISYVVPSGRQNVEVRVEVIDEKGTREVLYPQVRDYVGGQPPKLIPGSVMTVPGITYTNETTVQFFVDRVLHKSYYYSGDNPPVVSESPLNNSTSDGFPSNGLEVEELTPL